MAGATCLEAMARTIEDSIVPLILPFVTQVSVRAENRHRETEGEMSIQILSDEEEAGIKEMR